MSDNTFQKDIFRPGGLKLTDLGAQIANLNADSSVLDMGCGSGRSLKHLQDTWHCAISGIDLSPRAVDLARAKLPQACIMVGDAQSLPFEDYQFDAVFMECTLTLFSDPELALKEAHRVLKPGGTLIISSLSRSFGTKLVENGTLIPELLTDTLNSLGFSHITCEDHSSELVQFVVDIIFAYGSVAEYLAEASTAIDGTILSCNISPRNTHYHLFTGRKGAL